MSWVVIRSAILSKSSSTSKFSESVDILSNSDSSPLLLVAQSQKQSRISIRVLRFLRNCTTHHQVAADESPLKESSTDYDN